MAENAEAKRPGLAGVLHNIYSVQRLLEDEEACGIRRIIDKLEEFLELQLVKAVGQNGEGWLLEEKTADGGILFYVYRLPLPPALQGFTAEELRSFWNSDGNLFPSHLDVASGSNFEATVSEDCLFAEGWEKPA